MSPWMYLGVVLMWAGSLGATGWWFYGAGVDGEKAKQADTAETVREVKEAAQQGAAAEIAKIKPRNVTLQQEIQREIQTRVEYRDCRHGPDQLRRLNEALTGRADPAGGGELPRADAAH